MKEYNRAYRGSAFCPFYKRETAQMIICEGIAERSTVHVAFGERASALKWKGEYCRTKNCEKCPIYQIKRGGKD